MCGMGLGGDVWEVLVCVHYYGYEPVWVTVPVLIEKSTLCDFMNCGGDMEGC